MSEALLGPKAGHTYTYKMSEAYEDGVLHDVSLVEVHTGTTAEIVKIEETLGANIQEYPDPMQPLPSRDRR